MDLPACGLDNFREQFEAREQRPASFKHQTQALEADTRTVERRLRWRRDPLLEGISIWIALGLTLAFPLSVQAETFHCGALVPTLIAPAAIAGGGLAAGIPEFAVRKSEVVREPHLESFRMALRLGVPIAAGTDAGTPLNPHGTMVPELALMVKAGLAPLAAIHAATGAAACALGLEHETGRVAAGLAADLLAVAGDPTERIEALDDVRLVIAQGRTVVNQI